jgi:D-xylose 1-dehydrogenase (NADP+, D-xylono-1,5-lactone-forming)
MAFRIGIIGGGGIARAHGRAAQQVEAADLVAVCDVSAEAAAGFGDEFEVEQRYTDIGEMLDKAGLDLVIICTWGCYHADISNQVTRSGKVKAVLCEKPFCDTAAQCKSMIAAAGEGDVLLAEAFKFRHHPQHLKAKELIDAGQIGLVRHIRSTFTIAANPETMTPAHNWRFDPKRSGGAVYDLGCYNIHHARFIAGADPIKVHAVGQIGAVSGVDESVAALLEFPDGLTAQLSLTFRYFNSQEVEIYGEKGYLRIERAWNNENTATVLEAQLKDGSRARYDFAPVDQFALQLAHTLECIEKGMPHRISLENSLGNMRTIDAVFAAIKSGEVVTL